MNRALHPISEVKNIAFLSGGIEQALNSPTYGVALMARQINLTHMGCKCNDGTCSTCRAYVARHERNLQYLEAIRAAQW